MRLSMTVLSCLHASGRGDSMAHEHVRLRACQTGREDYVDRICHHFSGMVVFHVQVN